MWPFSKRPTRESLQGYKKVSVLGQRFVIRRLSPIADFDADSMPQIFTDTTRFSRPDLSDPAVVRRIIRDMKAVVQAGVVDPPLAASGKPELNVDDVFRDQDVGRLLYSAIIEHSLLRIKAWQVPFFLAAKLLLRPIVWLRSTGLGRATSPSRGSP